MKKLLVCFIAIAMSIGFVLTPAMAQNDKDPHYPNMYVDPGGVADLLLFSLFDVRAVDGRGDLWENYIAIENTSGKWTAFHLRFRAWKKSIEVYDHVILLSPYDVFWMTLSRATDSGPTTYPCSTCPGGFESYEEGDVIMLSYDTHTLYNSGLIYENLGQTFWKDKFQDSLLVFNGFIEEGSVDKAPKEEMQAGYIEAIGLWQLSIPSGIEDTHDLSKVVNNVHPDPAIPGVTINVNDALDALFYRFFTPLGAGQASYKGAPVMNPPGYPAGNALYDCRDARNFVGCWSQYDIAPTIDSAWPDFSPVDWQYDGAEEKRSKSFGPVVRIERVTNKGLGDQNLVFVDEAPFATRYGEDCGNVLTGMVYMGDPKNGKFQMENFIAVRNFRTDAKTGGWTHTYYTYDRDTTGARCEEWAQAPGWQHRDGYWGGGIFFPASINDWYYQVAGRFTGGAPETYYWYYVNPDYSTAAGPILHDGNDFYGLNFNDVNDENAENLRDDYNPAITNYGLTRPFPFQGKALENRVYAFVHYFNDIWSLDDLETALAKYEIWYTHLRTRASEGAKGDMNTDVVFTYPTKHSHWFFTDWPFMYRSWEGYCPTHMPVPKELNSRVEAVDVSQFWANLLEYRGDGVALFPELYGTFFGEKSVEQLIIYASDHGDIVEEEFIEDNYNIDELTLAQWFQNTWWNGRIYLKRSIWDNEQNPPVPPPPDEPPGSPWFPSPPPNRWAPHEVNIVQVGSLAPVWAGANPPGSIHDLNWLLAAARGPQFGKGHFVVAQSYLSLGERVLFDYRSDVEDTFDDIPQHTIYKGSAYLIPPIGLVIHNHDFGDAQVGITRSAMAEWHYIQEWIKLSDCKFRVNGCEEE